MKVVSLFGRQSSSWSYRWVRRARLSWRAESTDRIPAVSRHHQCLQGLIELWSCDRVPRNNGVEADKCFLVGREVTTTYILYFERIKINKSIFVALSYLFSYFLKKNQNAPRRSEHPPVKGGEMSKRLGGIEGCKYKTSSWHLNGFPDGNNIGSTV